VAGRKDSPDPLGKRALFWFPIEEPDPPAVTRRWSFVPDRGAKARTSTKGKRALYTSTDGSRRSTTVVAAGTPQDPADLGDRQRVVEAKSGTGRGVFAVRCSSCASVTAVGLLELVALHTPFTAFVPLRRFDHWMRCPACRRRTWAGVTMTR
jgi:hypothetical protein